MEGLLLGAVKQKHNRMQEGLLGCGHQTQCLQHGHNHDLRVSSSCT